MPIAQPARAATNSPDLLRRYCAGRGSVISQADVEALREGLKALETDGVDGLLSFIHPDFETTTPAELTLEPDTYRGHDGLRRYFAAFEGVMEDVRFVPV